MPEAAAKQLVIATAEQQRHSQYDAPQAGSWHPEAAAQVPGQRTALRFFDGGAVVEKRRTPSDVRAFRVLVAKSQI